MYQYPYGDTQQLNLDWILTKIKELEAGGSGGGSSIEEVANTLISATYNASNAYRRYDYCYYNGKLYRCLSDTTGVFNPADWQEALIGDDIPILTRLINAVDAAAVMDVKFDTSGTNGKIQQKYHDEYHDVVEVDYTPVRNSKRPLSSNAGYELNGAINAITPLDTTPTSGSTKGITSGAVDSAISRVSEKHEITLSNKVTTNITAFAVNGIGYINFGFNNQSVPTTAYWTTMATLESEYRPSAERYFDTLIIMDGDSEVHVGRITTSGNIDINHLSGTHTISSIRATIPYVI